MLRFMNQFKILEYSILLLLCIIYFMITSIHLETPYFDCNEAYIGIGSWQLLINKGILYDRLLRPLHVFGRYLPIMSDEYQTALLSYFLVPFFYLFGVSVAVIRFSGIFFGSLVIIFTYFFAKRAFNKAIAFITILLLFIDFTFIVWAKSGMYYRLPVILMIVCSLACLLEWQIKKRILLYYLGVFFLGLGLATEIASIYFFGSLFITMLLFSKSTESIIKQEHHFILKYLLGGFCFFLLGIFLFLIYNYFYNGFTIKFIFDHFPISGSGVDNTNYLLNLSKRLGQFSGLISNSFALDYPAVTYDSILKYYLKPCLFLFSVIWISINYIFDKKKYKIAFVLINLIIFSLLLSPFVIMTLTDGQLIFLYPLPQMIIAYAVFDFVQVISKNKIRKKLAYSFLSILICAVIYDNLIKLKTYYSALSVKGGSPGYYNTVALYDLANWLKQNNISIYVPLNEQLTHNIFFLTRSSAYPILQPKDLKEVYNKIDNFSERELVYISGSDELKRFSDLIKQKNKRAIVIKEFFTRDNQVDIVAFKII